MPSATGGGPRRDARATGRVSDPWTRTTGSLMMMVGAPTGRGGRVHRPPGAR